MIEILSLVAHNIESGEIYILKDYQKSLKNTNELSEYKKKIEKDYDNLGIKVELWFTTKHK